MSTPTYILRVRRYDEDDRLAHVLERTEDEELAMRWLWHYARPSAETGARHDRRVDVYIQVLP